MPWATPRSTIVAFDAAFERAAESEAVLTVTLPDGSTLDLIRFDAVGYDFVARVENDPAVSVFRAFERTLHVLGIDREVLPALELEPATPVLGVGGVHERGVCRYAVLKQLFRHDGGFPETLDDGTDRSVQCDDDPIVREKSVCFGSDEQLPHGVSPSSADVSAPTDS